MPNAPCAMRHAQCPMPNAQCPMPHAPYLLVEVRPITPLWRYLNN
ncbi:hypothetical protein [Nostoc sp. UHCC 0251]|nr:hypothetical protein [Nostoc sp. UHCC 0251]MEA5622299.1 hypothetical protein [Nostoc sp. UHCC 0251]